ncbi:unnamed protein product, partial [marine sediment metagenome]
IPQFAAVGRILNPELDKVSTQEAAEKSYEAIDAFVEKIDMKMTLKDVNMPEEEIPELAKRSMVLPDYKANPLVSTKNEMLKLIKQSYKGEKNV